eukprot:15353444-Alexandrium_andersonii.AAC.1
MSASLVGSEMCIRDRRLRRARRPASSPSETACRVEQLRPFLGPRSTSSCLLYTSDAADDM